MQEPGAALATVPASDRSNIDFQHLIQHAVTVTIQVSHIPHCGKMDAPIIVNKAKHAKNVCKRQSGCCVPLKVEPRQLKGPCPNVLLGSSGTIATHILLFPRPNHVNLPRGRRTCIGPCRMSSLSARCTCTASCSSRIYFLKRYTFETKKVNLVSFQKMRSIFCFKKLFLKRYKVRIF